MIYRGQIVLDRELSFTQAESLRLFFRAPQTTRPYPRACFNVGPSGRSIEWDRDEDTKNQEVALADIMNLYLNKWNIKCNGVIHAVDTSKKDSFDIIVIRNMVKTLRDNIIKDVQKSV